MFVPLCMLIALLLLDAWLPGESTDESAVLSRSAPVDDRNDAGDSGSDKAAGGPGLAVVLAALIEPPPPLRRDPFRMCC